MRSSSRRARLFAAHVLKILKFLSCAGLTKPLGDKNNGNLRLWIGAVTRVVQGNHSPALPPPGTVSDMPPLPAFPAFHEFVRGGGTLLKLLRADSSGGGAITGNAGKTAGKGGSGEIKTQAQEIEHLLLVPRFQGV